MLTRYAQQKINKLNKGKAKIQIQIKHTLGKPTCINLKNKKTKKQPGVDWSSSSGVKFTRSGL